MNEMRQLIGKRLEGEGTPRSKAGILPAPRTMDPFSADGIARTLQDVVSDADQELTRAASNHETMQDDLKVLASDFKEVGRWSIAGDLLSFIIIRPRNRQIWKRRGSSFKTRNVNVS